MTPSLLDRLQDDQPGASRDPEPVRGRQALQACIQAVRRDLENLLGTRRVHHGFPPTFTELPRSLADYGLPDMTAQNMASQRARDDFLRTVETTIRLFEPRLRNVRVRFADESESLDRTLRFRVEALLRLDPAPERVVFDSQLEPVTGAVRIHAPAP